MLRPLLAALLALPPVGGGDILVLKDGRSFDGLSLELVDGAYVARYPSGEVRVPLESVQDALMENPPPFVPMSAEERERAAKGQVLHGGKWMTPEKREQTIKKQLEEKRAELEEARACAEWRNRNVVETKHFRFEFAVPEHVFAPFRENMEAYFEAFAKDWGIKQPRELGVLPISFYSNYPQFLQVVGGSWGLQGQFRFVTPMALDFYYDRTNPAGVQGTMFHETNHYLTKLLAIDFMMPHFPGESLAEYYSGSRYDPETKKFESGLIVEDRLNEVKQDLLEGEMWGLEKLVSTDGLYQHYTWGWSLVHYLMHDRDHSKKFQKFIVNLCKGVGIKGELHRLGPDTLRGVESKDVWELFKKELDLRTTADVTALESAWHTYVKDELKTAGPEGKADAAYRAERGGFVIKARRLYGEAIAEGDARAVTRHRYAWLLSSEDDDNGAAEQWRAAVEADPMEALYRYYLGRLLKEDMGLKEEGLAHLRLARDMNPEGIFDDSWRQRIELDWDDIFDE